MADSLFSASTPIDQANYGVHLGVWTNWSRGPIFGATLTLTRQQGSLLISFTAFFVTIVASRFWMATCLVLHRYFSAAEPRDALHHQRQAIFRNSASSGSGLWSLIQLLYAWRRLGQRRLIRTLPCIIFSAFCLVFFVFASGFSSSISTAVGDEVLVDATNCGWPDAAQLSSDDLIAFIDPWVAGSINNAANYAQQVYSPAGTGIFDNTIFVKRRLDTTLNGEAPCPFRSDLCRSSSSKLILDSGYKDARDDFGINIRKEQSFQIRQVLHCAPLVTESHKEQIQSSQRNYTQYNYGPLYGGNTSLSRPGYTLIIKDVDTQYIQETTQNPFNGYGLTLIVSLTARGKPINFIGGFNAQEGLRRPDADIFLIFLSGNGVKTPVPTNDPWYRSNVPLGRRIVTTGRSGNSPAYRPEESASPLGCTYQVQVCKGPSGGNVSCGPLASSNDAWEGAAALFGLKEKNVFSTYKSFDPLIAAYANDEDAGRFIWLAGIQFNYPGTITRPILTLGYQSLDSYKAYLSGVQTRVADNQWKLDVTSWWNISLALQQASFVDTAFGSTYSGTSRFNKNVTNPGQKSICQNQKIISTRYMSMSLFGLYFTYIVGTLIVIISFVLEPILSYAQKRWKYREYENLEWISNGTLNLQRLAYDESGQGNWSKCTEPVPVTNANELLGSLDLTNLEHPKLSRSSASITPIKQVSGPTFLGSSLSLYSQSTTAIPSFIELYEDQEPHIANESLLPFNKVVDEEPHLGI
ncbi:hypothetical protein NUW58_g4116 [Xylaria curta]|uniref:Uncharacterized protein n=1 Tax=Xylaria curta TaxID=42375 RepID=A0ACC1PAV7_9PEZI|nr:hypothetical protein NUW58_g4116 [Xylaria curta]